MAATPVAAKYAGKLAAADVFTLDNAAAMVNSMRIDAGVLGPFGIHQWKEPDLDGVGLPLMPPDMRG